MAIAFIARYGQLLLAKKHENQITGKEEKHRYDTDRYFDSRLTKENLFEDILISSKRKRRRLMIPEIKRILYATDLSKNSAYAFFYATDIAKRYNAKIVILHSIERIRYFDDGMTLQLGEMLEEAKKQERKTDIEEIKKGIQEFCKRTEAQMGEPCVELVSKILVPLGNPVEEILKAADEENCDAIVLGTHGKGFLRQTFLGSVAGSVLQRTRKPVFIIPLPSEPSEQVEKRR